jgi:hypothetical protein
MKVAIETGPMFRGVYSSGAGFDVGAYYDQISPQEYLFGRGEVVKAIAGALQPDFLQVGGEPDTEQELTGAPVNSPAAYLTLTNYFAGQLASVGRSGRLGVGVGTWDPDATAFLRAYCTASVDVIDLHVYPINQNFLSQALSLADMAHACGKGVTISEAWMLKARDGELRQTSSNAVDPSLFSRDAYSFWAPLDASFLSTMVKFSHVEKAELLSAYWSRYFYAYLDYDTVKQGGCGTPSHACSAAEIIDLSTTAAARAIASGGYTSTGRAYQGQIAP